jgi:5'-phosphate synthase pdxT subunit
LILPGGESTTVSRLLRTSNLESPVRDRIRDATPTLGTCAGLILLSNSVLDGRDDQVALDALDATVRRNAYGTQLASFEAPVEIPSIGTEPFPGVFIRAPVVERVGEAVTVLAELDGHPVLCRQGSVWASTFHPELSGDLRVHQAFLGDGP